MTRQRPVRLRVAAWWRRLTGSAAVATAAFGLLACACALVAVAGPRANAELRTNAFRQLVSGTSALAKTVVGTIDSNSLSTATNRLTVTQTQLAEAGGLLESQLSRALPLGPARAMWAGLSSPFTATGLGPESPQLELTYRDPLSRYVRVLKGSLPAGRPRARGQPVLQVAVTAATAKRFGLAVGSQVALSGPGLKLKVTGIIAPVDVSAPFWAFDPIAAAPVLAQPANAPAYWQGCAFVAASALPLLQEKFDPTAVQVTWLYPMALGHLTAAQATRLAQRLPGTLASAGQLTFNFRGTASQAPAQNVATVSLESGATGLLNEFASQGAAVGNLLDLMSVSLTVVGAAIVLLTAWLMAEQRRDEFAMLRARGASRRQLATAALTVSAIAALPGAAAGMVLAVILTPGAGSPLAWWLGGLTVLVVLAGPVVISARQHRGYAGSDRPDRPASRMSAIRRLVTESALTLVCVSGLIVLRDQAAGQHSDLVASAAPVLVAIPVALIMLRLYPAAARPLMRLAARRSGVIGFLGLARAARVAAAAVLPGFAMVLALSLVSFAGMVRAAVVRGEVAQSWQEAGADAVVSTAPAAMTAAQQRSVAAIGGIEATAPVAATTGSRGYSGSTLTVLVASPARYAALLAATPLGRPPASFAGWRGGAVRPGGHLSAGQSPPVVPVLASPGIAARFGGKPAPLVVAGQRVLVRVVGTGPAASALQEIANSNVTGYLVLPASALGADAPAPDMLLVAGQHLDGRALTKLVGGWRSTGGSVTLRSRLLSALEHAPVQRDAYAELLFGGIAAAIGCLLVLLLVLLLTARSRQLTLARTATMGLSTTQGRWLTLVEALPQLAAVLIGGLICALGLAPLVGPALDLAVFTGSATPVPVRIEPVSLTATAIGLIVLATATVSVQTMLADREAARSLRIGG